MIDLTEARHAVESDVTHALQHQLPDGAGWRLDAGFPDWDDNPIRDSTSTAIGVPWTWEGINEGLLELAPTGRPVTVRGFTIVTEDPDVHGGLLCHRYVDWLPALTQAGLAVFTRPIVELTMLHDESTLREIPELAEAFAEVKAIEDEFGELLGIEPPPDD